MPGTERPRVARWEWTALAGIVLVTSTFVWTQIDRYWFRSDDWVFLNRDTASVSDWFEPHSGYPMTIPTLAYGAMRSAAGATYYPGYPLFRIAGYALVLALLWRIMRHRGADPLIALVAVAYLGVMASSAIYSVISVGLYVAIPALLVSFLVVDERPHPSAGDRAVVAVALLLAAFSAGIGGLGLASLVVVVACSSERRRAWLPPILGIAAVYGVWVIAFRDEILVIQGRSRVDMLQDLPEDIVKLAGDVLEQVLYPRVEVGVVLAVAAFSGIAWALWRRHLGVFENAALLTTLVFFAGISVNRLHSFSLGTTDSIRFSNAPAMLLITAFVPLLPRPRAAAGRVVVLVIGALLITAQVYDFRDTADTVTATSRAVQGNVRAMSKLLLAGEPYLDVGTPGRAKPSDILGLAGESGWTTDSSVPEEVARGMLRFEVAYVFAPDQLDGRGVPPLLPGGEPLTACRTVASGGPPLAFELEVGRPARFYVRSDDGEPVDVTLATHDRFGTGVKRVKIGKVQRVSVADPPSGHPQVSVEASKGEVSVCPTAQQTP